MATAVYERNNYAQAGGGNQQIFIRGGSAPKLNPLLIYRSFFTKWEPLLYTFY